MRHILWSSSLAAALVLGGCSSSYPAKHGREAPANVTYPMAFGSYQRVYNTAYHIVNRYGVVKRASYRSGEIEAEISQDTSLFDKTRKTILARIFDAGDYYEVECRVLLAVEDSEVETFGEFQPRYQWRTVSGDQFLETRLNNEIKAALTGKAFQAKTPLSKENAAAPAPGRRRAVEAPAEEGRREEKKAAPKEREASSPQPHGLREARATVPAPAEEKAEPGIERTAVKLMEQGEWARAASLLAVAPRAPHARYLRAQALFATGDYEKAAAALREGSPVEDGWARARVELRAFYGEAKALDGHVARLEKHQTENPKDRDAALVRGYVAWATGDHRRAVAALAPLAEGDETAAVWLKLAQVELDRASGLAEF